MKTKEDLPRAYCDAPYSALAHAVVLQAMEDFFNGKCSKRSLARFFHSSWCELLCADLGVHPHRIWRWLCAKRRHKT